MEATRGTAHIQREHHGKDGASIIGGLTVRVAVADGVRAQLGSFDEDDKRQSHHDGLGLLAVDVVAGPKHEAIMAWKRRGIVQSCMASKAQHYSFVSLFQFTESRESLQRAL